MSSYRAVATKKQWGWTAEISELQLKASAVSLRALRDELKEMAEGKDVVVEIRLGNSELRERTMTLFRRRQELEELQAWIKRETWSLTWALNRQGFQQVDIAAIVGLTPQRISQIIRQKLHNVPSLDQRVSNEVG